MTFSRGCRILALTVAIAYPLAVAGIMAFVIFGPIPESAW